MDTDDLIIVVLAALATGSCLGAIRALTRRPRQVVLAILLVVLSGLFGCGSWFWATFQIRMF